MMGDRYMYDVVLVDDEEWSLKTSRVLFHWDEYGFRIILATTDPNKALEVLKTKHVDVLLLDLCMPRLSGIEMLKEIRNNGNHAKVVILSGYSNFEFAQTAITYNVFEYCLKPLSENKAIEVITRLKEELDRENGVYENLVAYNEIENVSFNKMIKYIDQCYTEKLYLNELADKFGINLTYCCYLFKKHFDCGFNIYVTNVKMKKAAKMLCEDKMNIDEIASYLNYEYVYFNKLFKKYYNKTPRQYRIEYINKG